MLGVLDLADVTVETPAIVADRIRRALPYVDAKKIVVAPDCGLKYLPREVAFRKMRAMVEGTLVVRSELSRGSRTDQSTRPARKVKTTPGVSAGVIEYQTKNS
jgi:5-methyltetrahydropteroyltriglutamate--homocysteine methyltransferase